MSELKAAEVWAREKGHIGARAWYLAAARAHERWPVGREVTEAEYDAAVLAATNTALR
jgi:hypothetical protein